MFKHDFTTDFSDPASVLATLAARNTPNPAPAPAPRSAPTTASAPAPSSSPSAPAPSPAPVPRPDPNIYANTYDLEMSAAKQALDSEMNAFAQRESRGQSVSPRERAQAQARYTNAIRGIQAKKSLDARRAKRPTRKATAPAPAPAPASAPAASATASPQSTQVPPAVNPVNQSSSLLLRELLRPMNPEAMVSNLLRTTPTAKVSELASLPSSPAPTPQPAAEPVSAPDSAAILSRLSPETKRRLASAGTDQTSSFGYALRSLTKDDRNQLIISLSNMSPEEQLFALDQMDAQSNRRRITDDAALASTTGATLVQNLQNFEQSLPLEYRQERDALLEEYRRLPGNALTGFDPDNMAPAAKAKFEQDLHRRLASKYPDRFGSTISPTTTPNTLAEHLSSNVRDLDARTPGLRLGTQLESGLGTLAATGPFAPIGAAIAGTGAVAGAATSPTFEDDASLAAISAVLGKGGIRSRGVPAPQTTPPTQLPPRTLVTPEPGPLPPNRQIGRTLITPEPGPLPPNRQLPASSGGITDDALTELRTQAPAPTPAPAPAPASKQGLAVQSRASDPAVAAREAAATPSPGTGIPVRAPDEQGLLPGFRRSTAPEGARNQNVVREFQTAPDSPTFQVVTDPTSGRTGAFTFIDDRPIVFVNIKGETVPFYRSSAGTSGKTQGQFYPFHGTSRDGWFIKSDLKNLESGYNIPEVQQAQAYLNRTFKAATPEEAVSQMRRFFNSPVPDQTDGARALLNRGAMQEGGAGSFAPIPEGRVDARTLFNPGADPAARTQATTDFRRFMGERVGAMKDRPAVSTPDMAPGAPRDVPGQRMLPFDRAERTAQKRAIKAAEEQAAIERNLRSRVSQILESFASGGG